MPLTIPRPPQGPLETTRIELGTKEAFLQQRDALGQAPDRLGLISPRAGADKSAGPTGTRAQTRQSFSILRFYQENPDLAPFFQEAEPERHRYFTGVRLYAAQARSVMERVQVGIEAAAVLTKGQVTEDVDLIEDHLSARWRDPQVAFQDRLWLEQRIDDPTQLRRLTEESEAEKRTRRQGRKLLRARARGEAQTLREERRDREALRSKGGGR